MSDQTLSEGFERSWLIDACQLRPLQKELREMNKGKVQFRPCQKDFRVTTSLEVLQEAETTPLMEE